MALVFTIIGSESYLDELKNTVHDNDLNDILFLQGKKPGSEIPLYLANAEHPYSYYL